MIKPQPTAPRTAWHLPTLAFLAITAWGCAAGGSPPTAQPQATLGPSIAATVPAATAAPAVTPVPAPSRAPALPAAPPEALLAGVDGAPVPGDLGGYTWNGAGSDAPWLVPPGTRAVRASGPYAVRFGSDLAPAGWVLRWAPVKDGVVGDVAGWAEGAGAPVTASGPDEPGAWSLQADVRFADGHGAAWYWLVDTAP